MNLIERAKNILLSPKTEWNVIKGESTTQKQLIVGYVLPLAAVAAVCGFLGSLFVIGSLGVMGIVFGLVGMILHLVIAVVAVFVVAYVIDALATTFGAAKNIGQAFKVAAYSFTASFVGGILGIIPFVGWLLGLLVALYGLYLLYLGLMQVMGAPTDKALGYTAVVTLVAIVVLVIANMIIGAIMAIGVGGGMYMQGGLRGDAGRRQHQSMAKLEEFGKKMEAAGKKMEDAQKSGDPNKQMEAAMGAMGTVLSGGKGVEPVQIDALKPFVPEKFAGLPRADMRTERSGVAGLMVAKAEGDYREGDKHVRLEVTDTGGAAGLMGMAAWMGIQGEREDSSRREVTRKEGDRLIHEQVSKTGGSNEFTVVLASRYIVSTKGNADINALKSAVASLDLGKLESLK
jgi:hypothetical protein